jgi:nucleoside 2-deoxyribosyltransferase
MKNSNKKYLYLAGSITIWRNQFKDKYSKLFRKKIKLFEPGKMNIPHDHRQIKESVAKTDSREIQKSDAVLAYMKDYKAAKHGGPVGTDSSWECGFACGLGKPVIALIDDKKQIEYYRHQWMVTFHIKAFVSFDKKLVDELSSDAHFKKSDIIYIEDLQLLEESLYLYLSEK